MSIIRKRQREKTVKLTTFSISIQTGCDRGKEHLVRENE